MARVRALLGSIFTLLACDGTFAFDTHTPFGGGGMAGRPTAGAGTSATSGAGGSGAGGSGAGGSSALECETRCRAAGLSCLEARQLCVECVEDEDCFARGLRRCGVSGETSNRCLECSSSDDCSLGKQCDLGTHSCVTECTASGDPVCVATGLECNPWHLICAACYDSSHDCDDVQLRCSVGDARCVQCVDHDECGDQPGKWCDPVLLSCVACRDSFDCGSSQETCDPVAHVCR